MKKHIREYEHELEGTYEKRKTGSSSLDAKRRLNPSRALSRNRRGDGWFCERV